LFPLVLFNRAIRLQPRTSRAPCRWEPFADGRQHRSAHGDPAGLHRRLPALRLPEDVDGRPRARRRHLRQGLYLHFASKDELFKQGATWLAQQGLAAMRAELAREDVAIEERLVGAFAALHAQSDGSQMSLEHMNEIVATARQLIGPVLEDFEQTVLKELTRAIQSGGDAIAWRGAGLTAKALAQHLQAVSHGLKHYARRRPSTRPESAPRAPRVRRTRAGATAPQPDPDLGMKRTPFHLLLIGVIAMSTFSLCACGASPTASHESPQQRDGRITTSCRVCSSAF
jgi:AcrR family transcriptional regulator